MVDLTFEMAGLWTALGPAPLDRGRVVQFVAATAGEGTSTVAREFARLAAVRARKPVWLVDADLELQTQAAEVAAEPERFGRPGKPAGASPDGSCFFTVQPPVRDRSGGPVPDSRLLLARPALGGRLWVTELRSDRLGHAHRARLLPIPAWWEVMRRHAELVVVDCPPPERADAATALAPFVDLTVLVVAADTGEAAEPAALRRAEEAAGGRVAGLVFNRARVEAPRLLRRFVS
jgi:Mrp family chromosome partitioning ATPase